MEIMKNMIVGVSATIVISLLIGLSLGIACVIGVSPIMYLGAMLALLTTGLIGLLLYLLGETVLEE